MIQHYLTLAFRNLWKYRTQNAVSIMGLAVGFTCFALATLWIHYETTYDKTMEKIDHTYLLYKNNNSKDMSKFAFYPYASRLAAPTLKREFPEVEAATGYMIDNEGSTVRTSAGKEVTMRQLQADSTMLTIYPAAGELLQGSMDFLYNKQRVALTEEAAMQLFGTTQVLGDSVKVNDQPFTIGAILRNVEQHSNLYFGCWNMPAEFDSRYAEWQRNQCLTLVRLRAGSDVKVFCQKIQTYRTNEGEADYKPFEGYDLIPLGKYHCSDVNTDLPVRLQYLYLFCATGILIIGCALLNYLSLFIVRMRTRRREVELRRMCGSSRGDLLRLFGAEYLLTLLLAGLLGMVLVELLLPPFRRLSQVNGAVYGETTLYFIGVLLLAYLCLLPFVWWQRPASAKGRREVGSRGSIGLQLVVGLLFTFCVSVMMLQLRHLSKGDLGWDRHNTAVLFMCGLSPDGYEAMVRGVDALPMVTETLKGVNPLFVRMNTIQETFDDWEGKVAGVTEPQTLTLTVIGEGEPFANFYHLQLLEGQMVKEGDADHILLNQTAVRTLGMTHPVGKKLGRYTIVGVLKDFYVNAPTLPVAPMMLCGKYTRKHADLAQMIVLKYREGTWKELKQRIETLRTTPPLAASDWIDLINIEERYDQLLVSEQMLFRLLGIASLTCVLIAMFGIFSLVSLRCEQRRKEIAIRKVNGARVGDILALFAREHLWLLLAAAIIAFPIGYVLMKRWLQSYTYQVAIAPWLYLVIFLGAALLIALCIGWRVWQAARSNPADTIKAE